MILKFQLNFLEYWPVKCPISLASDTLADKPKAPWNTVLPSDLPRKEQNWQKQRIHFIIWSPDHNTTRPNTTTLSPDSIVTETKFFFLVDRGIIHTKSMIDKQRFFSITSKYITSHIQKVGRVRRLHDSALLAWKSISQIFQTIL
jgi:hypothetical protein